MAKTASKGRVRLIALLFDVKTRRFLGKGGKWVPAAEIEADPPQSPEDVFPKKTTEGDEIDKGPDPGPTYPCIDGEIWVCSGGSCRNLHIPCE